MIEHRSGTIGRREALGRCAAGLLLFVRATQARARERPEAVQRLIGDAKPLAAGLTLELPFVSEDGSSVPLTVRADAPAAQDHYIRSVHLFASRNPTPEIASFELSPLIGRVNLTTRVRLNETQSVIAVARSSRNAVLLAEREVRVTVSGCLARAAATDPSQEMQTRVRIPGKLQAGTPAEVLTLIQHPMDTGLAADASGRTIPQRIVRSFEANFAGQSLLRATFHRSLAANPYLRFYFVPRTGGTLELKWTEDTGRSARYSGQISVN